MKIAIHDHSFFCLQERFLKEKTELAVYAGTTAVPGDFNLTCEAGKVKQTFDLLTESNVDAFLTATTTGGHQDYDALRALGRPVLGYSHACSVLEQNRGFAFQLTKQLGLQLKLPQQERFYSLSDLTAFLKVKKNGSRSWVLKQGAVSSSSDEYYPIRTVISHPNHINTLKFAATNRAWFTDGSVGDIVLEEYVAGHEVSFGAWFDGEHFLLPIYAYEEHKDAQNGSRSLIQTGEVGTWLTWFHEPKGAIVEVFRKLEPYLKGKCNGMIDINTIVNPKTGEMSLIEFTPRFGRPTIEVMIGSSNHTASWSRALSAIAKGADNRQDLWAKLFSIKHAVGVTVFSYGYPLTSDQPSIPFSMPSVMKRPHKGTNQSCQTHLATYSNGTWTTFADNRQFVVVGASDDLAQARELAYEPLKSYQLLGCTWRDDVAQKHSVILNALAALGVLYE